MFLKQRKIVPVSGDLLSIAGKESKGIRLKKEETNANFPVHLSHHRYHSGMNIPSDQIPQNPIQLNIPLMQQRRRNTAPHHKTPQRTKDLLPMSQCQVPQYILRVPHVYVLTG